MLEGEELAITPQTRLNLIAHQQHAAFTADRRSLAELSRWRNNDACLSVDRLNQEHTGVRCNSLTERLSIAIRNDLESRRKRPKAVAILFVGREAHDGDGAAMK